MVFMQWYLSLCTIRPLCMKKVHEVTSFVRFMNKFNSLNNQISTRAHSSNSQKYVICKKIRGQSLHVSQIGKSIT